MPARPKMIRVKLTGTKNRPDPDGHELLTRYGFVLEPSPDTGLPSGVQTELDEQVWPGQKFNTLESKPRPVYIWTYRHYVKKFALNSDEQIVESGSNTAATTCPSDGAQIAIDMFKDTLDDQMKVLEGLRSYMESNCLKIIYIEVADVTTAGSPEVPLAEVIYDPFNMEGKQATSTPSVAEGGRRRRRRVKKTRSKKRPALRRRTVRR
jgi:hypothetical protein